MTAIKYIFLLALLTTCGKVISQTLDIGSAKKYWQIVDLVRQDKPISDSLWAEFRNLKANGLWFSMAEKMNQEYEPLYRTAIEIVFRPSKQAKLDSILKLPKDTPRNVLNIFVRGMYQTYNSKEQSIRTFLDRIASANYLDTIYTITLTMLPKNFERPTQKLSKLNIYIHGIEDGANATQHGIIFSMAGLYEFEKYSFGIMGAHELHHLLRVSKLKDSVKNVHRFAIEIMESCLNEGTADILSHLPVIDKPEFSNLREMTLLKSEQKINTIDKWFSESLGKTQTTKTTKDVANLFEYLGGHNPGFFMAKTIVDSGLKDELKQSIDNPFNFFILYQKAAELDKGRAPTFSKKTLRYIRHLESLYLVK